MKRGPRLLLVGGGRWARVYLSVLAGLDTVTDEVVVASHHGGEVLDLALQKANERSVNRFSRIDHWQNAAGIFDAAIIVNAAFEHAQTAIALLDKGVGILIEKPAAIGVNQASALVECARRAGRPVRQAIVLNHCAYLRNFVIAARSALGPVTAMDIAWQDAGESRYGETKTIDLGVGLADDVGPHIAALIAAVTPAPVQLETVSIAHGGLGVNFSGVAGQISLKAALQRNTPKRRRLVILRDVGGGAATLDFSREPGTITIQSAIQNADPEWGRRQTPLALQLQDFLLQKDGSPNDLAAIVQTASFCAALAEAARAAQRQALLRPQEGPAVLTALRELLAPHLAAAGLVAPGDNDALGQQVQKALAGDAALAGVMGAAGLSHERLAGIPKSHMPGS